MMIATKYIYEYMFLFWVLSKASVNSNTQVIASSFSSCLYMKQEYSWGQVPVVTPFIAKCFYLVGKQRYHTTITAITTKSYDAISLCTQNTQPKISLGKKIMPQRVLFSHRLSFLPAFTLLHVPVLLILSSHKLNLQLLSFKLSLILLLSCYSLSLELGQNESSH